MCFSIKADIILKKWQEVREIEDNKMKIIETVEEEGVNKEAKETG